MIHFTLVYLVDEELKSSMQIFNLHTYTCEHYSRYCFDTMPHLLITNKAAESKWERKREMPKSNETLRKWFYQKPIKPHKAHNKYFYVSPPNEEAQVLRATYLEENTHHIQTQSLSIHLFVHSLKCLVLRCVTLLLARSQNIWMVKCSNWNSVKAKRRSLYILSARALIHKKTTSHIQNYLPRERERERVCVCSSSIRANLLLQTL